MTSEKSNQNSVVRVNLRAVLVIVAVLSLVATLGGCLLNKIDQHEHPGLSAQMIAVSRQIEMVGSSLGVRIDELSRNFRDRMDDLSGQIRDLRQSPP